MNENPYLNVLRSLEDDIYPHLAAAAAPGVGHAPSLSVQVKVAEALAVVRSSRTFSPVATFACLTATNSTVQLVRLASLSEPHSISNLLASAFGNVALLVQAAIVAAQVLSNAKRTILRSEGRESIAPTWWRRKRARAVLLIGGFSLLFLDFFFSLVSLLSSLLLRESFFSARDSLVALASDPAASSTSTITSVFAALARPVDEVMRDLQMLRVWKVRKDAVELGLEVYIVIVTVLALSVVSTLIRPSFRLSRPRLSRSSRRRASSITKEARLAESDVESGAGSPLEALAFTRAARRNAAALAALSLSVFAYSILTNYTFALDLVGKRWTSPETSFAPLEIWPSYLYLSVSIVANACLVRSHFSSAPTTTCLSFLSTMPLERLEQGYRIPHMTESPLSSPSLFGSPATTDSFALDAVPSPYGTLDASASDDNNPQERSSSSSSSAPSAILDSVPVLESGFGARAFRLATMTRPVLDRAESYDSTDSRDSTTSSSPALGGRSGSD
ncbi:hypothetical protein JCM10212_002999 [Sporobolomyces blumeae]